jgi:hypothetical protein
VKLGPEGGYDEARMRIRAIAKVGEMTANFISFMALPMLSALPASPSSNRT